MLKSIIYIYMAKNQIRLNVLVYEPFGGVHHCNHNIFIIIYIEQLNRLMSFEFWQQLKGE